MTTELRPAEGLSTEARPSTVRRSASPGFRWESEMLPPLVAATSALVAGLPMAEQAETFYEVPLAAGVPDLAVVAFDADVIDERLNAGLAPVVDVSQLRTLVALASGSSDLEELAGVTGLSLSHLRRRVVPALAAAGWIESLPARARNVVVLHSHRSLVRWSVTVEAKRSAWAQATAQATRHLPAADRAFVALDAARAGRAIATAEHLAATGVGLVTVTAPTTEDDVATTSVVRYPNPLRPRLPRRHRDPHPVAKGLLGERVWDLRLRGLQSGPTYLVFGRNLEIA